MPNFFGKYRGQVVENIDPDALGRLYVNAPAVLGMGNAVWAMPCVPYAGSEVGFWVIPPVGANVWVEFEGGNLDYPIWSGCFWAKGEIPPRSGGSPKVKVFQTNGCVLEFNDLDDEGGVTLSVSAPVVTTPMSLTFNNIGAKITNEIGTILLGEEGITLSSGDATILISGASVVINEGALEVI